MTKNILAIRTDRFGEFLLNIPAFRALKSKFPHAKLSLVVNPAVVELAECIDCVDEVISWENRKHSIIEMLLFSNKLRKEKFDLCVIFNPVRELNIISFLAGIGQRVGYARKWDFLLTHKMKDLKRDGTKHEVLYNLDLVGLVGASGNPEGLYLTLEDDKIEALPEGFNSDNSVVIHPWASDPVKRWPAHKFLLLAARLIRELGLKIIFVGGREELENSRELFKGFQDNAINLIGKTSLKQLAIILKRCRLLISADSGPVHLAACVNSPVIALFRNDLIGKSARRWGPRSKGSIVLENKNLADISVEEVFSKVKALLGSAQSAE